jgi:hypothetical protein
MNRYNKNYMEKLFETRNIVIAFILAAMLGEGAYLLSIHNENDIHKTDPSVPHTVVSSGFRSLSDLLAIEAPARCTLVSSSSTMNTVGTVYVAKGKMRGDFTNTRQSGVGAGRVTAGHMIINDAMSYSWSDGAMKFGMKVPLSQIIGVQSTQEQTPVNKMATEFNEKSDYHCTSWTPDEAVFLPPSTITFNDLPQMMQGVSSTTLVHLKKNFSKDQLNAMCSACNQEGANKARCKAALGCQ